VPAGLLKQGEHRFDVRVRRDVAQMHRAVQGCGSGQKRQGRVLGPVDSHRTGKGGAGPDGDHFGGDWGDS
jgi:hypothetical protein